MKKFFLTVFIISCVCLSCCSPKKVDNNSTDYLLTENPKERVKEQNTTEKDNLESDKEFSEYNNPIDRCFMPIIYSEENSEVKIREAQDKYKELWMQEFENLMKVLHNKCIYDEDKKNIEILKKSIRNEIEAEMKVITTELLDAYKVNPDPKEENDISRMSLWGNGTRSRLNQIEGEIYRDASMRIINIYGFISGEKYEFRKNDYSVNN